MHRIFRIGWQKSDPIKKGDNVSFRRQLDDIGKQRNVRDFAYISAAILSKKARKIKQLIRAGLPVRPFSFTNILD